MKKTRKMNRIEPFDRGIRIHLLDTRHLTDARHIAVVDVHRQIRIEGIGIRVYAGRHTNVSDRITRLSLQTTENA